LYYGGKRPATGDGIAYAIFPLAPHSSISGGMEGLREAPPRTIAAATAKEKVEGAWEPAGWRAAAPAMASDEERAGAGGAASLRVDPPPGSRPSTGVLFPKLRRSCPSPGLPPSTGGCNEEAAEGGRRPGVGGRKKWWWMGWDDGWVYFSADRWTPAGC
jgi:hypothetical protein